MSKARLVQIWAAIYKLLWSITPIFICLPHRAVIAGFKRIFKTAYEYKNSAILAWYILLGGLLISFAIQKLLDVIGGKDDDGDSRFIFAPKADSIVIKVTNFLLIIQGVAMIPLTISLLIRNPLITISIIAIAALIISGYAKKALKLLGKALLFVFSIIVMGLSFVWTKIKEANIL